MALRVDKNVGNEGAKEAFQKVSNAFEWLQLHTAPARPQQTYPQQPTPPARPQQTNETGTENWNNQGEKPTNAKRYARNG